MKLTPWRAMGTVTLAIVGIRVLITVCVWLVTPPKQPPPVPPNPRDVPHKWKVAKMRRRIHVGMPIEQVHQILGTPAYSAGCTPPGDVPDTPNARDEWNGQGGSLYVYYRASSRPDGDEVVTDVGTDPFPAFLLSPHDNME